jgi:uncharacterized protein
MRVEWDEVKARDNRINHGIAFPHAEAVLFDPLALSIEDTDSEGEQRHISLGQDALGRILLVVYTYRDENTIRLISARKASSGEVKAYER